MIESTSSEVDKMVPGHEPVGDELQLVDRLQEAIVEYDADRAREVAKEVVARGLDPMFVIKRAIGRSAAEVGRRFDTGEYFLPHLVLAGDAMVAATEVLEAALPSEQVQTKKVAVIGTVEGDLHTVGKNIVAMMFRAGGFEIHDLGCNVKSSAFIAKAREVNADVIALSSLLTTTMPYMREVIDDLKVANLRDRFKVVVGGGPVTSAFAEQIGADGFGRDAVEGLRVARALVGLEG